MKINSILGKMNGKIGNMVVTSVGGEVIGREYNPNVANPNTSGQRNTRAKFKLASQLSAAMAPVIAIRKEGLKSARNIFVSTNFPSISFSNNQATINLNAVQLTKSQKTFVGFKANRTGGTAIAVELSASMADVADRVVYILYLKQADGSLQYADSKVCSVAGADGKFTDSLAYNAGDVVCYAYAIKDLDSGITSKFGNMTAPSAEQVAKLLVSNSENMASVSLTKTAGLTMNTGTNTAESSTVTSNVIITVTSSPEGLATVSGGGSYEHGDEVTVTTAAAQGVAAAFEGWHENGQLVSDSQTYTFTADQNRTLVANWAEQ